MWTFNGIKDGENESINNGIFLFIFATLIATKLGDHKPAVELYEKAAAIKNQIKGGSSHYDATRDLPLWIRCYVKRDYCISKHLMNGIVRLRSTHCKVTIFLMQLSRDWVTCISMDWVWRSQKIWQSNTLLSQKVVQNQRNK